MESRLVPVNAILDLALADGLNPAPLADAGWTVAALEVPVKVSGKTVVCDVVLFNSQAGHLLAVEAKSGANLEPEQGRRLTALTPQLLIIAGANHSFRRICHANCSRRCSWPKASTGK